MARDRIHQMRAIGKLAEVTWWLEHDDELQERARRGLEFAALCTQEQDAHRFLHEVHLFLRERSAKPILQ